MANNTFSVDRGEIMKTIGYLRVSSETQDIEKNKADILLFANEKQLGQVIWVSEIVSGRVSWRQRRIGEVIDNLRVYR